MSCVLAYFKSLLTFEGELLAWSIFFFFCCFTPLIYLQSDKYNGFSYLSLSEEIHHWDLRPFLEWGCIEEAKVFSPSNPCFCQWGWREWLYEYSSKLDTIRCLLNNFFLLFYFIFKLLIFLITENIWCFPLNISLSHFEASGDSWSSEVSASLPVTWSRVLLFVSSIIRWHLGTWGRASCPCLSMVTGSL